MDSFGWDSDDIPDFCERGSDPFKLPDLEFELSEPDDDQSSPVFHAPPTQRLPPPTQRLPPPTQRLPPPTQRLPPPTQRLPLPTQHTTPITVITQPPDTWFQFNEGNIPFMFSVSSDIDPELVTIGLVYTDTSKPVGDEKSIRVYDRQVVDYGSYRTVECAIKIKEISKNHQKRRFSIMLTYCKNVVVSNGFYVKTKRTKRKIFGTIRPRTEDQFKRQARNVLRQLEWTIGGYESSCQGYVDMNKPIYECPICRNRQSNGHTSTCSLKILL